MSTVMRWQIQATPETVQIHERPRLILIHLTLRLLSFCLENSVWFEQNQFVFCSDSKRRIFAGTMFIPLQHKILGLNAVSPSFKLELKSLMSWRMTLSSPVGRMWMYSAILIWDNRIITIPSHLTKSLGEQYWPKSQFKKDKTTSLFSGQLTFLFLVFDRFEKP